MPQAGFEPTILASERPQTHALDRAATGIGLGSNPGLSGGRQATNRLSHCTAVKVYYIGCYYLCYIITIFCDLSTFTSHVHKT